MKLSFRETGIPKWLQRRLLILGLIFVISLVFFQIILNLDEGDKKVSMSEASLPVVTIDAYDHTMAKLHGYKDAMDACYMRDALILLDSKRQMDLSVDTYGLDVDSASYEIRSLDTQRKIADTTIDSWTKGDDLLTTTLQVENLVDEGDEYQFILTLTCGDSEYYYYTRILLPEETYAQKCLEFTDAFHETSMSDSYTELSVYMETDDYTDKEDLGSVSITSSLDQVGWKGFSGKQVDEPIVSFTDINDTYASLVYSYQMSASDDGITTYYNVEEYYKVRYTDQQIYLLDFNRTMEEIINSSTVSVKDNQLSIGITSGDVEYLSNETGTIVSFVQAGELYQYNQSKQTFTKVFGFIDDPTDSRETYNQHNIRILNIDETGNMDFVVYGYMNRGSHEGQCGIDLYHYDSIKDQASEQVFIATTHSYQVLNADFSDLLYENTKGDFYIMYGGTLAKVGADDLDSDELITNLKSDQYAVSSSGRYIAWVTGDSMADEIQVMDLENETTRTISAKSGELIKPISFMTEDLVYGIASESDITTDTAGTTIYPMKSIKIVDTGSDDFTELKTYQKDGIYITDVIKDSYTLYLTRITKQSDGSYIQADEDTIKDTAGEQNKTVSIEKVSDDALGRNTNFVMTALSDDKSIKSISTDQAKLAASSNVRNVTIDQTSSQETYFVYVGNRITNSTQNLTKAIASADADMGLVIDNQQRYIWKRGKKSYVNAFTDIETTSSDQGQTTSAGCINAMLAKEGVSAEVHALLNQGETPISILSSSLKDSLVLDLTGCSLSEALYYVSQGTPVYAGTGQDEALLIIGYDASNITVYHADTDTYTKMSTDTATATFEAAGNVFISYVK